ncbi:hypothetical protein [Aquamicrobium sp.]|uniref:hypothetical protein n=1 Tax=Aquamicrobium sp. TaxID=1872579 RepID=UPI00258447BD|nr:hypothetical protein [Aquamicrobium sp.]MCK9553496.1 hypothetical protein [Aquamicrobium sp.]
MTNKITPLTAASADPVAEHATQACNLQPVAAQAQPVLIEQIAGQWDGCIYDAGGSGDIDIGGAIRAAARKLAQQPVSGADGLPGASSS